jgi:uncharacterized membrane protein
MTDRMQTYENQATSRESGIVFPTIDKPLSTRLQRRYAARRERQQNVGDTERVVSIALGSMLAVYGLTRRSWTGGLLAGLGAFIAYRGATGYSSVYHRIGIERPGAPIEIAQSITINRSRHEVYAYWRNLENLPRFMPYLRAVQQRSERRSHWIANVPVSGRTVQWESEIVDDIPNELIRWYALPGGSLSHSGEVRFMQAPGDRGTEVHVRMRYEPPAGIALGALLYPFGKEVVAEELRRLKRLLEAGEIPNNDGPSGKLPRRYEEDAS